METNLQSDAVAGAQSIAAGSVLLSEASTSLAEAEALMLLGQSRLQERTADGISADVRQCAEHAFAWLATTVEALRQMLRWGQSLEDSGKFNETEQLTLQVLFGEYAAQIFGGICMSQGETARPPDYGITWEEADECFSSSTRAFIAKASNAAARVRLTQLIASRSLSEGFGDTALDDDLEEIRNQLRRFTDEKVKPYAQQWHLTNSLIPGALIGELSEMGIFGLTVPEEYGGAGMPKAAMCVVSEELSRGYLGVGSLATRSEIAAELVRCGGTTEQAQEWLPKIASGEALPTAVFTEPGAGSDLGSLTTRADLDGEIYRVFGSKTWITHAVRANLMTILVRTDPKTSDYRGLSMLLAGKQPGSEEDPFPDGGISGSEIDVIGYRGMKEYDLVFDGFEVSAARLLGGEEGKGFRQLMETFESARIQTAARAIGVAHSALEAAIGYATERRQFGRSLTEFPRVASKIALMAAELMACRQLTYFAARQKDSGRRCDLEAGMAKLLAARVAWSAADNAVQIHGGNGFALEAPVSRILCDARILSIFEGASEIQAGVIASRLLNRRVN